MAIPVSVEDRRSRRRRETIEEVVEHALDVMATEGVAGLSLGEIARRMGIRTPSLYVYFSSKNALYDALFQRGWELLAAEFGTIPQPVATDDLAEYLTRIGQGFTRWSVEHRAYAQLLMWRPVPGYEPSEAAYEPAVRFFLDGLARFERMRSEGLVGAEVDPELMLRRWTVLISGVVTQQLANAPDEPFETGRFTTQLPALAAMFAASYAKRS